MKYKIRRFLRSKRQQRKVAIICSLCALCIGLIITSQATKAVQKTNNPTTKPTSKESNFTCTKDNKTVHIIMDSELNLLKLTYVIKYENESDISKDELDLYNSAYGVFATSNENTVTIKYDLSKITLTQIQEELKPLIKNTIFEKAQVLPISYTELKETELKGYKCN